MCSDLDQCVERTSCIFHSIHFFYQRNGILQGFSVTAPGRLFWFLDENENIVVISIMGVNAKKLLINTHEGSDRYAVTEIPSTEGQCARQPTVHLYGHPGACLDVYFLVK